MSCKVDALRVFVQQGVEWVMPEEASVSEAPSEYMNRTAYLRVRSTFAYSTCSSPYTSSFKAMAFLQARQTPGMKDSRWMES